ncbi:alkyl sulfatase C-terminal domain-containing protein [Streptomyces sp. NPDC005728]|uniref:alkyl sulfatase C-terminal domain-containing protein n=1 Tax=Streptomyces sp. NPDC005728 TaxID=3157054 RepID=UPI0033EB7808
MPLAKGAAVLCLSACRSRHRRRLRRTRAPSEAVRATGKAGRPETPDMLAALTLDQVFDSLAIRVDGRRSWDADITVRWNLKDGEPVTMRLRNGVLTHVTGTGPAAGDPDVWITLAETDLRAVLLATLGLTDLTERTDVPALWWRVDEPVSSPLAGGRRGSGPARTRTRRRRRTRDA